MFMAIEKSMKLLGSKETGFISSRGVNIKLFIASFVGGVKNEIVDSTGVLFAYISPVRASSVKSFKDILFFILFTST